MWKILSLLLIITFFTGCFESPPTLYERVEPNIEKGWTIAYFKDSETRPYGWTGRSGCSYFRIEDQARAYFELWFCPPGWTSYKDDLIPYPISAEKIESTAEYDIYYYSMVSEMEPVLHITNAFK